MRLSFFSAKPYDKTYFDLAHAARDPPSPIKITYHDIPLNEDTVSTARDADAVCAFVNDSLSADVIEGLARQGVKAILLRCAGFNHVDLDAAARHGIMVANVPSYSPAAVAEFAVALIQTLNRNTHRAYNRVREGNFALHGLLGRTLHGKTVGLVGVGRIGLATARIMKASGAASLLTTHFHRLRLRSTASTRTWTRCCPSRILSASTVPLWTRRGTSSATAPSPR
jgi:D-lactate dehydrogenase